MSKKQKQHAQDKKDAATPTQCADQGTTQCAEQKRSGNMKKKEN